MNRLRYTLFLISLFSANLNAQQSPFVEKLSQLERDYWYNLEDNNIDAIDSLVVSYELTQDELAQANILRGYVHYEHDDTDSLSLLYFNRAKDYYLSNRDTLSYDYARILIGFAVVSEDHQTIVDYSNKGLKILDEPDDQSLYRALALQELAYHKTYLQKSTGIDSLFNLAESIFINNLGQIHARIGEFHNAKAISLKWRGEYKNAVDAYTKALSMLEVSGGKSRDYANVLRNKAILLRRMHDYRGSEEALLEVIGIFRQLNATDTELYYRTCNSLAIIYNYLEEFEKAEGFYDEALEGIATIRGENSEPYANILHNKSRMIGDLGRIHEAVEMQRIVIEYYKNTAGLDSYNYANSLNSLASTLSSTKEGLEEAYELQKEVLRIFALYFDENHDSYMTCLNNLVFDAFYLGKFDEADQYINQLEDITFSSTDMGRYRESQVYNLRALYYHYQGQDTKATPLFFKTKEVRGDIWPPRHSNSTGLAISTIKSLYNTKAYDKALKMAIENTNYTIDALKAAFEYMSEKEKYAYHQNVIGSFDLLERIGLTTQSTVSMESVYETLLFEKGLHLMSSLRTKEFVLNQGDQKMKDVYASIKESKSQLGKYYEGAQATEEQIDSLKTEIGQKESILAKAYTLFKNEQQSNAVRGSSVYKTLEPGEIIVEFSMIDSNVTRYIAQEELVYTAIVLTHEGPLGFRTLCGAEELGKSVNSHNRNAQYINDLYGGATRGLISNNEEQKSLYELLIEPIQDLLDGAHTIYFAPVGLINRLNLNAIALNEETVLVDNYKMINMMSSRAIVDEPYSGLKGSAYVVGGVDFERFELDTTLIVESARNSEDINFDLVTRSINGNNWKPLKWTIKESQVITDKFRNSGFDVIYRSGVESTEEDFKAIGTNTPSPQVIHLATHGYFISDPESTDSLASNKFELANHPLLRSGLILSGGNHVWSGGESTYLREDGILTAYEISNMNLSNTELVVLSACETALGDIRGSEGVFGLQRAFKMAGVDNIIMSLWQIPDRQTKDFMVTFYEHWLEDGLTIREAFNMTQLEMRDRFYDAHAWAGFVLIE